jgi:glutamate-1-semialdehyde 2,1-aminomutase
MTERGSQIAAVILEPVVGNMGLVVPDKEFLAELRKQTDFYNTVLIFDEVMTGFRLTAGGAQELFGVTPDLTTLGKIVGGGLPVGAYGGRQDIMNHVLPAGKVFQAGTLSGNPLATSAGLATLSALARPDVYQQLEASGAALEDAITSSGLPVVVNRIGSMLTPFFTDGPVTDYASATRSDTAAYGQLARTLLANGVYPPPSQFEAWFTGLTHGEAELAHTREALKRAAANA